MKKQIKIDLRLQYQNDTGIQAQSITSEINHLYVHDFVLLTDYISWLENRLENQPTSSSIFLTNG